MRNYTKKLFVSVIFFMLLTFFMSVPAVHAATFSKKAPVVKATQKGAKVTLKWGKRSELTGYRVYSCNVAGKKRKLVKKTESNKVTLKNLTPGNTYYYRVRGYQQTKKGKLKYTSYSKVTKVHVVQTSTLKDLLLTGLEPVGTTMYIWGGGWNKADTGAGKEARTIGVSPNWYAFFKQQTSGYNYENTRYQISKGLDCSGYIGWCIYNLLETKNGKPGYVMKARNMAENFASRGWGSYTEATRVKNYRAGDIMSSGSHVWMVVGACSDGSVVLMHSSPPGVRIAGTPTPGGKTDSRAVALAKKYMKKYFPEWYAKYPDCTTYSSYLTQYNQMRWDISGNSVMKDPDNYSSKTADKILKNLFKSFH